jgi:hypothetical protein
VREFLAKQFTVALDEPRELRHEALVQELTEISEFENACLVVAELDANLDLLDTFIAILIFDYFDQVNASTTPRLVAFYPGRKAAVLVLVQEFYAVFYRMPSEHFWT